MQRHFFESPFFFLVYTKYPVPAAPASTRIIAAAAIHISVEDMPVCVPLLCEADAADVGVKSDEVTDALPLGLAEELPLGVAEELPDVPASPAADPDISEREIPLPD